MRIINDDIIQYWRYSIQKTGLQWRVTENVETNEGGSSNQQAKSQKHSIFETDADDIPTSNGNTMACQYW